MTDHDPHAEIEDDSADRPLPLLPPEPPLHDPLPHSGLGSRRLDGHGLGADRLREHGLGSAHVSKADRTEAHERQAIPLGGLDAVLDDAILVTPGTLLPDDAPAEPDSADESD